MNVPLYKDFGGKLLIWIKSAHLQWLKTFWVFKLPVDKIDSIKQLKLQFKNWLMTDSCVLYIIS